MWGVDAMKALLSTYAVILLHVILSSSSVLQKGTPYFLSLLLLFVNELSLQVSIAR